jgi:hypothetical protein
VKKTSFWMTRNGNLYDRITKYEELGFVLGTEESDGDDMYELIDIWEGKYSDGKTRCFEYPPVKYEKPIEYIGLEEIILGYNIIQPWGAHMDVFSMSFINKLTELGFKDFTFTPVLIYFVEGKEQIINWEISQIRANYQPRDDLFAVLQLTNPPIENPETIAMRNFGNPDFEFPLLFLSKSTGHPIQLRCNALGKEIFSQPEFRGLSIY